MNILKFLREKPRPQPKPSADEDRSSMAELVRLLEQAPQRIQRK
jgi:hypothetical protein